MAQKDCNKLVIQRNGEPSVHPEHGAKGHSSLKKAVYLPPYHFTATASHSRYYSHFPLNHLDHARYPIHTQRVAHPIVPAGHIFVTFFKADKLPLGLLAGSVVYVARTSLHASGDLSVLPFSRLFLGSSAAAAVSVSLPQSLAGLIK